MLLDCTQGVDCDAICNLLLHQLVDMIHSFYTLSSCGTSILQHALFCLISYI